MSKLARTTRPRRLLAAGAAIVGLAAVTTVAVAALQPGSGIRSARGDAKTTLPSKPDIASFDLVMTTVRRSGTKLVFSEQVSGKAGATVPAPSGKLAGSEVFNLHARATDLAVATKRRSIVAFVRAVAQAAAALKDDPEAHWPHVSSVTGFTTEEISWGWPEMEFPVRIIPDMLDVLEVEDVWVAKERDRAPRSREELARFIDASVVEEALASD